MSTESKSQQLDHLPDWMQVRCAVCGEYALPESGLVATGGKPWQHFYAKDCDANRQRMATLPVEATVMYQALVEAGRTLGVLMSECAENNWNDEVAAAVVAAMDSIDRGLDARKLVAFKAPVGGGR